MTLHQCLEAAAKVAPEKVGQNCGDFYWKTPGYRYIDSDDRFDVAAITHLMFSEMRDRWNGPRALWEAERKSLGPLFVNTIPRTLTDERIWEVWLAWLQAQRGEGEK